MRKAREEVTSDGSLVATANLEIRAVVPQGSNSLVRLETRSAIVPQTPEDFAYDTDGNLLSDGLWSYSWDGENRLVAMQSAAAVPDPMKKKLTFAYDHQGRRVRKAKNAVLQFLNLET